MNRRLLVAIPLVLLALPTDAARADVTAFLGATTTPSNRPVWGFSAGLALLAVGFEFEFSDSVEDLASGLPGLRTGMGNVYVQNPIPLAGIQFYGTIGGGIYRERLGALQETNGGSNLGGGIKIAVAGPLKLRLDYRIFSLAGNPMHKRPQRLYAGLTLGF